MLKIDIFMGKKNEPWALFHIKSNLKDIVSVGNLRAQKRYDLLIEAFSKIHDLYPEDKLIMYGEGPCRESLEKQIVELKEGVVGTPDLYLIS